MKIQLSDHFTYGRLFRFTLPSIVMMVLRQSMVSLTVFSFQISLEKLHLLRSI